MQIKNQIKSSKMLIIKYFFIIILFGFIATSFSSASNSDDFLFIKISGIIHPLDEVSVFCNGTGSLTVSGSEGRVYFKTPASGNISFRAGGASGTQKITFYDKSGNLLLEGFIIANAKHCCWASFASKNATYRNLKIVSDNAVGGGMDIVESYDDLVDGCFNRTKDDCIAVKSGVNYFTKFNSSFTVDHLVVQNSVKWNGTWGKGLKIGFETRCDTIQNITSCNYDLIHMEGPEGTFTIHNGDRALVRNIPYEDIRFEDARGWLIDFKMLKARYSKDTTRDRIENEHFNNISVEGEQLPYSQLQGCNDTFNTRNVLLENFYQHGVKVKSTYNADFSNSYRKTGIQITRKKLIFTSITTSK